jgi:hypothetical protein
MMTTRHRRATLMALLSPVLLILGVIVPESAAHAAGFYPYANLSSGKCMDVYGGGTSNGTAVDQYTCSGGQNQQWEVSFVKNIVSTPVYELIPENATAKCLDVSGGGTSNGSTLDIYSCDQANNQLWYANYDGVTFSWEFQGVGSSKCVDDPGSSPNNGVTLVIYTCGTQANQEWTQ